MAALSGHESLVRLLLNFSTVQVDAATSITVHLLFRNVLYSLNHT